MDDVERFPRLVSLACHDLRTPLATVYGFARTLTRDEGHDERTARFLGMIETASEQMTVLLDELGLAARIMGGRFEPILQEADTLEFARSGRRTGRRRSGLRRDRRVRSRCRAVGAAALAVAALRHGPVEHAPGSSTVVCWRCRRSRRPQRRSSPATSIRDLGALVGRMTLEALGASLGGRGRDASRQLLAPPVAVGAPPVCWSSGSCP